jgi:hypothetical protein
MNSNPTNMNKSRILAVVVPIILIACFVILSGWQTGPTVGKTTEDTTKKANKKASYSRKTIITFDKNGEPHEQTFEDFDGDEGLRKLMQLDGDFDFVMPPIPDINFAMPAFPRDFQFPMPSEFEFDEAFGEEMEALMKEKFEALGPEFEEKMKELEEKLQGMDFNHKYQFDGMNKNWEEQLEKLEHLQDLGHLDQNLKHLDENLKHLDENLKYMNESIKAFEKDAQEELIRDGYLKEGERIESMEWMDDNIKFNGIKIKPEHHEKYRELKEKHIKHQWQRGRPE